MACFINSCQCQPMHSSLVLEGQSHVYHSQCILASSISLSVLACFAKCGHCVRRSESGMALAVMSLQSSHLTHACMHTTLCAMSHHVSFLLLNGGWNSVPSRNGSCVNAIHRKSICLREDLPQWFHESALEVHMIHCDSLATLAPVCLLRSERDLVCNTPCMVASVVTRRSCDSHPCHFAHTRDNLCSSLRATEWFECTMHITCIHLVVTPLVCVHQEWWVLEHEVCG